MKKKRPWGLELLICLVHKWTFTKNKRSIVYFIFIYNHSTWSNTNPTLNQSGTWKRDLCYKKKKKKTWRELIITFRVIIACVHLSPWMKGLAREPWAWMLRLQRELRYLSGDFWQINWFRDCNTTGEAVDGQQPLDLRLILHIVVWTRKSYWLLSANMYILQTDEVRQLSGIPS